MNLDFMTTGTTACVCNTLMLSHICRYLPTARHQACVCSAGSKGYCATKDMLQSGIPGHTLLIESKDLRDVGSSEAGDESCCLVGTTSEEPLALGNRIPATVKHVTVFFNGTCLPPSLLCNSSIVSVDLGSLSHVQSIQAGSRSI